jgi:hypothetical protein
VNRVRTVVLPALMALIGIAIVVRTAIEGSVLGIVVGLLFVGAGAGRIFVERAR